MKKIAVALFIAIVTVAVRPALAAKSVAYQINIAHSGVQTDTNLAPPYVQKWAATFPGAVSYPLVADGLVFVTAVTEPAQPHVTLYALDSQTGQLVWSRGVPNTFDWANAAYENGRIFVLNYDGVLTACNAANGTLIWSKQLPNQDAFTSPPTVSNGIVYTGGAGGGGTVYSVDAATGNVLATTFVENGDESSPALSANSVFVSYACNQAYAFAPVTLLAQWHHNGPCEGGGGKTTVYESGRLFTRDVVTSNLILDASTGSQLGTYNATAAPAARGNTIWALNGSTLSAVNVANPATPATLWTFSGDGGLRSAPILISSAAGDYVIEGSVSGMVYALNAINGSVVWSANAGSSISGPDEQSARLLTGFGAGEGLLLIPAGNRLVAYANVPGQLPALSSSALLMLAIVLLLFAFAPLAKS